MKHRELRDAYISFFEERKHTVIKHAPMVLQGDATTLFTSSGMQPLVPFLSGKEQHPKGKRLVNIQPCIRTQDIDEVGDNRHTTFFEMMGNWSVGDYFKREQLQWKWEFLTKVLGLPVERLYVTVFAGDAGIEKDTEAASLWKEIGVPEDHIFFYSENWWSRSGPPSSMPEGEIGGPDSEVFYDFGDGPHEGPESDEERFLEIGNSVFIQYEKDADGNMVELPQKNVDFGGGFERILAAMQNDPDIFKTDVLLGVVESVEKITGASYEDNAEAIRIVSDHMRAAVFLIHDGITPSNKEHGYILRRLLRRSAVKMYALMNGTEGLMELSKIAASVINTYKDVYFDGSEVDSIKGVIHEEMKRFSATLERGLKEIEKLDEVALNTEAFNLYQSYGFPFEITEELAKKKGITLDVKQFNRLQEAHKELSRSSSEGKFKGGLADTSDQVVKYHTATHLLHQALKDVFGDVIRQEGSNITQDRLRFDSRLDHKPTDEELNKLQDIMNGKIADALPVFKVTMPKEEAEKLGAASFFREKYGDTVNVYFIGGSEDDYSNAYSKEFCGGPHVDNTEEIGSVEIFKVKKIGADLVRFYVR